jgi:hypothetical protein
MFGFCDLFGVGACVVLGDVGAPTRFRACLANN